MQDYHHEDRNTIKGLFNESEFDSILNCPKKDRRHPVKRLFGTNDDSDIQVLVNTAKAIKRISESRPNWLQQLKPRLLNLDDFSEPSGALGEIRAFGAMLESGMDIDPIPTGTEATADFRVCANSVYTYFEVHAKQYDGDESDNLERFNKGENSPDFETHKAIVSSAKGTGTIVSRMTVVTPFGKHRKGETTTENVISRLAAIKWEKGKEPQFPEGAPAILWLDFQDEIWNLGLGVSSIFPVSTWRGEFQSGEIWYAFYGWKDAPIFEAPSFNMNNRGKIVTMRHEGRFRMKTKLVACVLSFPRSTIIVENPFTDIMIPNNLRTSIPYLPWFQWEKCYLRWPSDTLAQRVDQEQQVIESLHNEFQHCQLPI